MADRPHVSEGQVIPGLGSGGGVVRHGDPVCPRLRNSAKDVLAGDTLGRMPVHHRAHMHMRAIQTAADSSMGITLNVNTSRCGNQTHDPYICEMVVLPTVLPKTMIILTIDTKMKMTTTFWSLKLPL